AVIEPPVSEHEAVSAGREVRAMIAPDLVERESRSEAVRRPLPEAPRRRGAEDERALDLREGPGLVAAVVPPGPQEDAGVLRDGLLEVHAEAVLRAPLRARRDHVRRSRARGESVAVGAHAGVVPETENADRACASEEGMVVLELEHLSVRVAHVV